jgi:hypothetical protein
VGRFAQHLREVHVIQGQHFAENIEDAISEDGAHLFELLQKTMKDASFNDGLAFLGLSRDEVVSVALKRLPNAVNAAQALLQASWVPRQIVVDHEVAELEVDSFAGRLSCYADLT